jgi:hypothetical protein
MADQILKEVENHPYLGVEMSHRLSWGDHKGNITQKANRSLNFIRRNLGKCSPKTKEMAYKSLVQPHLQYACAVWDPYQANHIKKLESVQSKAARFVLNRYDRYASATEMKKELGWIPQQAHRFTIRMTTFYKAINNHIVLPLPQYVTRNARISRNSHPYQYSIPSAHLDPYKFSFFPRTIRCWNILPPCIISSPTPEAFKASLLQALQKNEMFMVPPRDIFNRPRLGSSSDYSIGAVF